jgi:hypothetical protein
VRDDVHQALATLDEAARDMRSEHVQTEAVERALTDLLPYASRHDLDVFWRIAGQTGGMHRSFRLRRMVEVIGGMARKRAG